EVSTMAGPSVKEGMERTATLRDSRLDRLVDWRRAYPSAECTGTGTVGGKECWMVEMKPEEGNPLTFYYEKDSGFLVKISTVMQSAMGDVPVDTYLVEHREIDGVLLPWKIVVESMGSERTITNQSVEHNVDIPEGTFDIPEEISALLE
ncbi:MAG TPA: hypothetical protein VLA34_14925, partial [Candidatus Krumholzibacterium sp.]|nr:hypothetical protein [Candidatus Krumholzibacterium sp.]